MWRWPGSCRTIPVVLMLVVNVWLCAPLFAFTVFVVALTAASSVFVLYPASSVVPVCLWPGSVKYWPVYAMLVELLNEL